MTRVNRRRFLAGLATGTAVGLAGCQVSQRGVGDDANGATRTPEDDGTPVESETTPTDEGTVTPSESPTPRDPPSLAELGAPADICEASITEEFSIVEISEPAFDTDWQDYDIADRYLREDGTETLPGEATVVGRAVEGDARAYPVSVLWHHEIVNDTHGGSLIVTFCSICQSGMVARRVVDGQPTRFGVSGQLWRPPDKYIPASEKAGKTFGATRWDGGESSTRNGANLVMYDELTRSFWSQGVARAICGPATGTDLEILPSTVTTWAEWRADHPDGEVLLPPPHSSVDI